MSTKVPATDEFLAQETERTFYDYSFDYEGEVEQITDHDDVRVIQMPVSWFGVDGVVERMSFDSARVDERLDALFTEVGDRNFWWVVRPTSQHDDLIERRTARG